MLQGWLQLWPDYQERGVPPGQFPAVRVMLQMGEGDDSLLFSLPHALNPQAAEWLRKSGGAVQLLFCGQPGQFGLVPQRVAPLHSWGTVPKEIGSEPPSP